MIWGRDLIILLENLTPLEFLLDSVCGEKCVFSILFFSFFMDFGFWDSD
jgi:hypothetical protein